MNVFNCNLLIHAFVLFNCYEYRVLFEGSFLRILFWLSYFICMFCFEKGKGPLKQQISAVNPVLDELRLKKQERMKDFYETESQIARICIEIAGNDRSIDSADPEIDERDLTVKRLGELKSHLKELQNEKVCWIIVQYVVI